MVGMADRMKQVWERASRGLHGLVLGVESLELPSSDTVCVVGVDCARWERPLGPMLEARDKLDALVQQTRAPILIGGQPSDALLRRELVEDDDGRSDGHLVGLANRLQRQVAMPVVVVVEAIDEADDVTLELLTRMIAAESGLHVALLLTTRGASPADRPSFDRVVAALRSRLGDEAIFEIGVSEDAAEVADEPDGPALEDMPLEVLRVLRAGATVGDTFEAAVVSELLGLDVITTLELLQLAKDQGSPVRDLGEGVFRMPHGLGERLRDSITPSLASAWHRHLAFVLGDEPGGDDEATELDTESGEADGPPYRPVHAPDPREGARDEAPNGRSSRESRRLPDRASRAAEHAEAAGDADAAAQQYLEAATRAASLGAYERATELLARSSELLASGPPTRERRLLRLRGLIEMARIKWYAVGEQSEGFKLEDAVALLDRARSLTRADDPADLRAELSALSARVAYDIGSEQRLREALGWLDEAREALLDGGRPMNAARLLNDEAAIRVRLGEFERAGELLRRSRDVFSRYADSSPVARRELAETDLLVARLMLHAPEAHRRDPESLHWALESAHSAERAYQQMGDSRERARAWETLARLELLRDRPSAAMQFLRSAVAVQEQLGDVVGLARTTAALAEVMADTGMYDDALQLLSESVSLNRLKGSERGLAYNRAGLEELIGRLPPDHARRLGSTIEELRGQL